MTEVTFMVTVVIVMVATVVDQTFGLSVFVLFCFVC